jgi:thioredoxin reductase (NADPH)
VSEARRVIVIGSGPAGYTAGLYLARAELQPVILAGEQWGGQLMLTTEVENYPGFSDGIMGPELMQAMRAQAAKFGAEVVDKSVSKVDFSTRPFKVHLGGDQVATSQVVIIATGAQARLLGVPGEDKFMGRGVSTCAVCDAPFYKGKSLVYVVGGGDAAMEEVLALSKFAKKVGVIHRRKEFKASKIMQRKVEEKGNVEFLWNTEVLEIKGDEQARAVTVKNNQTGEIKELAMDGIFIAIGHEPATEVFAGQIELDRKGYVVTGKDEAYPTMTSVAGVFAAGDVVDWRYRQAVTAAGMGCMAALDAEKYLDNLKFKI